MPDEQSNILVLRILIVGLALALAVILRRESKLLRRAKVLLRYLARRPWVTAAIIVFLTFAINTTLTAIRYPKPLAHDEFSYLLAGDTFSHGRIANPQHPMWMHFETFHVLHQPSYASKYPPGNGIFLAVGQCLTGHAIVGVWLSLALANVAVYWMLRAWLPATWATLGGLLIAIHVPLHTSWGQTYWGGAVAMLGGALMFGGLRRIWQTPKIRDAVLLSIGLVILANSRPMEGFIASIPVFAALLYWLFRRSEIAWRKKLLNVAAPVAAIGTVGVAGILAYNWAVTNDPLMLPYKLHDQTYSASSVVIWKQPPGIPSYNHPRFNTLYVDWARQRQIELRSFSQYWPDLQRKLSLLFAFFPIGFGICLPAFAIRMRGDWIYFALGVLCLIFAIELQLTTSWIYPHYLAPVAALFYVLSFQGLRQLRVWKRSSGIGPVLASTVVLIGILRLASSFVENGLQQQTHPREAISDELEQIDGEHLVIVSYSSDYTPFHEWVYNKADIDAAKIIWARDMGSEQNRHLIEYYRNRRIWRWRLEPGHEILKPHSADGLSADATDQPLASAS